MGDHFSGYSRICLDIEARTSCSDMRTAGMDSARAEVCYSVVSNIVEQRTLYDDLVKSGDMRSLDDLLFSLPNCFS